MYILLLILLVLIAGMIIKIAWPLILAVVAILFVCFLLSILKQRQDERKKQENIIRDSYTEREE